MQYGIPLTVVSYKQLYGWTMDDIVREIGTRNNCTYCGVLRRQVLSTDTRHCIVSQPILSAHASIYAADYRIRYLQGLCVVMRGIYTHSAMCSGCACSYLVAMYTQMCGVALCVVHGGHVPWNVCSGCAWLCMMGMRPYVF